MSTFRARAIFALAVILILGEALTRFNDQRNHYDPNVFNRVRHYATAFRGYGPTWYEDGEIVDSRGRRHPMTTEPGRVRVLCVGGSTTEGQAGNDYPGFLAERDARLDVINAGVAGYATPHMISIVALDGITWAPQWIVAYENINDLTAAYFPNFEPDYEHKYGRYYGIADQMKGLITPANAIGQHSHLYWWVTRLPRRIELAWRFGAWRGAAPLNAESNMRTRPYGPYPPPAAAAAYRRNLESIAALVRGRARLVFVTQPFCATATRWVDTFGFKKYNDVVAYPPLEEVALHHAAYNQIVRDVASETGAALVDAERVVVDPAEFTDTVHLTQAGNRRLANAVLATIR